MLKTTDEREITPVMAETLFAIVRHKLQTGGAAPTQSDLATALDITLANTGRRLGRLGSLVTRRGQRPCRLAVSSEHVVNQIETAQLLLLFRKTCRNRKVQKLTEKEITSLAAEANVPGDEVHNLIETLVRYRYLLPVKHWDGRYELGPRTEKHLAYLELLGTLFTRKPRAARKRQPRKRQREKKLASSSSRSRQPSRTKP